MLDVPDARAKLAQLTDRQREVLDLVLEHKSSKEIAIVLGIAPNTVDQRIWAAREKLGVERRGELARTYGSLVAICGETTSGFSYMDFESATRQATGEVSEAGPVFTLSDAATFDVSAPWMDGPPSLKSLGALDNRFGFAGRLMAVVAIFALIAIAVLAVVTIMMNVSRII